MTEDEFFTELERLPRASYSFRFTPFGDIRCGRPPAHCLCPIQAVYLAKTGRPHVGVYVASNSLGLSTSIAARIASAADQGGDERYPATRRRLLSALGLQEAA